MPPPRKVRVLPAGNRFRIGVHAKGWNSDQSALREKTGEGVIPVAGNGGSRE
jgi:hypothetical protein